jgi:hypothetical protein
MATVAIIGVAAAAVGATAYSAYSSSEAADTQSEAAKASQDWQERVYWQTREDMAPWREAGVSALGTLQQKIGAGPGEYTASPYYNYLLESGTKGLERGAAAKGLQQSGAEQKALVGYGEQIGSAGYQQWLNNWYQSLTPYQSLSNLGQTTAQQTSSLGTTQASNIGQNILSGGQAQAAGQLGVANTIGNAVGWGGKNFGNYLTYNALNQAQNPYGTMSNFYQQNPNVYYGLYGGY